MSPSSSVDPEAWPRLAHVRPGRDAHLWLRRAVADFKSGDVFRPVTVIVPNDFAGRLARWHLARDAGYLNVTMLRLPSLALAIANEGAGSELRRIATIVEESAVRTAVYRRGGELAAIDHRSLHVALLELFRELRRREIPIDRLDLSSLTRTTGLALAVYQEYSELIQRYDTATSIALGAALRLEESETAPPALARLGLLILWLPARLDPAEVRLLAAASRLGPLAAAFVDAGQNGALTKAPAQEAARDLAAALGVELPVSQPVGMDVRSDLRVIRVSDPAEEVREVVRAIAAELPSGIPLHRVAIVYRQDDPYNQLVRETLDAAGLPWVSSEGLRLAATRPGRSLLGLLALPDRSFTREAVMEWLETGPVLDDDSAALPTATWDRLTRQANVVRGADQWDGRMRALAAAIEAEADELEREDRYPTTVELRRRQAVEAKAIAAFVLELAEKLKPPEAPCSWSSFVSWARALRDQYVGRPEQWPEGQREAAALVDEVLDALKSADRIEWARGIDLPTFLATLAGALEGQRIRTGQVGEGILVEPIAALNGLAFDRVYLLGLVDGSFPPVPAADPFFPSGGPDPLERRLRQVAKERQDFLVALASADGGRLTLTVPDSAGERAAIPSRWLLEVIRSTFGLVLDASEFANTGESGNEWLRVIQSAQQAVLRAETHLDLEDRRLSEVARWTTAGLPLRLHPLARRRGSPLQLAIDQRETRRGRGISRFDGNVSERAATARKLRDFSASGRAFSASAIQTWASCGFRYFLERVIGVEPTEQPEESPTLDALERGTLIHKILEEFFRERFPGGPLPTWESYGPRDIQRINRIADVEFAELVRRGATGHPLVWENTRDSIRADLQSFLALDARWRSKQGVSPHRFEQPFGMGPRGGDSWPSLEIRVAGGVLRFNGVIDRIDLDAAGKRAFVFDYKTGSTFSYDALETDPVAAGQHIQLALYSQVVRANLPGLESVGSAFWFISAKGEFAQIGLNASPEAIEQRLASVLGTITQGIQGGAFPRVPGTRSNGGLANCKFCDFDRICPDRRDQFARDHAEDPIAVLHASLGGTTAGSDESP